MVALSLLIVVIVLVLKLTDTLWNIEHVLKQSFMSTSAGSCGINSSAKQRFSIGIGERQQWFWQSCWLLLHPHVSITVCRIDTPRSQCCQCYHLWASVSPDTVATWCHVPAGHTSTGASALRSPAQAIAGIKRRINFPSGNFVDMVMVEIFGKLCPALK